MRDPFEESLRDLLNGRQAAETADSARLGRVSQGRQPSSRGRGSVQVCWGVGWKR
jgi:hypothetical protein